LRRLCASFPISNFLSNLNEGRGRVARMETKTRVLAEAYQLKVNDAISEHIHSADRRAQRTISNTATAIFKSVLAGSGVFFKNCALCLSQPQRFAIMIK
jgi:hypothetical protein